jgi:hypothetical protein
MTSPIERITIVCPRCGETFNDWYRASINADLDPALANEDYITEASTATCPSCKLRVELGPVTVLDWVD